MFTLFKKNYDELPMSKAKEKLEDDKDKNIVMLDVRTPSEYSTGHIKGSVNIPVAEIERVKDIITDANAKVFVYCLSGGRSKTACKYMVDNGYNNVTNIGGITQWDGELIR